MDSFKWLMIFQSVGNFTLLILSGVPVIYLPLAFVMGISALKDIFEDYKRH